MSDLIPTNYDELNFFDLFETLWTEKWKITIITFLVSLVGIIFNLNKDDVFQITVPLNNGNPAVFAHYYNLNELSKKHSFNISINSSHVFDLVVREFNDYEEMISVLQKDEIVKEQIKDFDEKSKQLFLMEYAKNFELLPGKSDEQYMRKWEIFAEWNDVENGKSLINDALYMTLLNVKKSIFNQIDLLSKNIDNRNQIELEMLNKELDLVSIIEDISNKSRIQYLSEQAAIARELGIETEADSYITDLVQSDNLAVNMTERPFYLRGYMAIEKELNNIQNRSKEEKMIMSPMYMTLMEKIIKLENDNTIFYLNQFADEIKDDGIIDWVEYDISRAESKLSNKSDFYIFFSFIIGLILGCIYVLIAKGFNRYKVSKLKV